VIIVHKLNGAEIRLNAELIECLEGGPQTCVILATGNRFLVVETPEEITERVVEYRRKVNAEGKAVNPIKGYKRENP